MKGGMVFFKGTGGQAARRYLEQDTQLAASGYYTENNQLLATRTAYTSDGTIEDIQLLTPEEYQGWVEWIDPRTGEKRGTLKERVHPVTGKTEQSVMFIDKTINAPKSLSVLAAIDPQFATVLERTMGRAAEAIGRYQAQNLHTRIMSQGVRSWVPVERLESATVVHKTSREGDPFWHLHFQTLNRVYVGGRWRALDTAELVKHNATINALGTAIINGDMELRAYLMEAGYTFNPHTGEIEELAGFIEDFSKRNAQINTRKKELIALWEAEHPGQLIGVDLMNRIDHQAWADTRADKTSENSANFEKWATELADLGFVAPTPSGRSTRFNALRNADSLAPGFYHDAATWVLAVLSEQKSGWSVADIKAEALTYCAENNVIAQASGLEDITGRIVDVTLSRCLLINPDIDPYRAPTHLPLLTSQQVVATESKLFDYTSALVARETSYELSYSPLAKPLKLGAHQSVDEQVLTRLFSSRVLTDVQGKRLSMPTDPAHRQALSDMAGTHQLVVVTGPAGAGKTTLLKASKAVVEAHGGRQFIVAPSAKAAEVAQAETGAQTNTAHGLLKAFGYDFSTDEHGVTTWSEPAENHHVPRAWALRPGDQLVVDEAGMLSQDVAVRLQEIALKTGAQLVVTGDYAQLSAVGRGGVLQQCAQISPVTTDLESVWRFRTATGEVDEAYAQLSLKMRARHNAGAIFDELVDRGAVVLHADEVSAQHALSQQWLKNQQAGHSTVVSASTNELVAGVNAEVALLRGVSGDTAYAQDIVDGRFVQSMEGQAITVGDIVRTRENNRELGVLNGKSYVVRGMTEGFVRVQSTDKDGSVHTLPVEYVASSVQLGYATTVHSSQGMTVDSAHLLVTGHTDAAGVYVGLTRGRFENVVHCVAADVDEAREQFVEALGRERADAGLGAVAEGLRQMLAGTDLETKRPEEYPVVGHVADMRAGDGLVAGGRKYLVAGTDGQGTIYAVGKNRGGKYAVQILQKPAGEAVAMVPGGAVPLPPSLSAEIQKYRNQYVQAHQALRFVQQTQDWVKAVRYRPQEILELTQAHQHLDTARQMMEQAQQDAATAREEYTHARHDFERQRGRAEYELKQAQQRRDSLGFFQKMVSSNIPLRQAERALDEITAQEPSRAQVQQANAQLAHAKEGYEQAQQRLAQAQEVLGQAPVLAGMSSAVVDQQGVIHEPDYQQISAQAKKQQQEAVQVLGQLTDWKLPAQVWSRQAQDRLDHSARVAKAVSARRAEVNHVSSPRGWDYDRGRGPGLER